MALGRSDEELRQEIDVAVRWSAVTDELRALQQLARDGEELAFGRTHRRRRAT